MDAWYSNAKEFSLVLMRMIKTIRETTTKINQTETLLEQD